MRTALISAAVEGQPPKQRVEP